jgi:hypothetical protein
LFPQTKRGGKGGERAKRSSGGSKKAVDVKDQVSVIGADGPAVGFPCFVAPEAFLIGFHRLPPVP